MNKQIFWSIVFCAVVVIFTMGSTSQVYGNGYTLNQGIAWDWGGFEFKGDVGPFFCPADWNQFPYDTGSMFEFLRPIWSLLPIVDC